MAYLVKKYLEDLKIPINEATVAIQGFGNVGSETALSLGDYGAKIIAISDYTGAYYNPKGIDVRRALNYVQYQKTLRDFDGGEAIAEIRVARKVEIREIGDLIRRISAGNFSMQVDVGGRVSQEKN